MSSDNPFSPSPEAVGFVFDLKNLLREESLNAMGTPLPGGVSLVQVTERCAQAAGWTQTEAGWQRSRADEGRRTNDDGRRMCLLCSLSTGVGSDLLFYREPSIIQAIGE
mgnify:CR=1 FL=1